MSYSCVTSSISFPPDLDLRVPDHVIIATAQAIITKEHLKESKRTPRETILVSRDINMRVICDSIGIKSEDYNTDKALESSAELYQGFAEQLVDDAIIDRFYNGEDVLIDDKDFKVKWYPNQYIMMVSNANPKKTALARFKDIHTPLHKVIHAGIPDWKIKSRNKEQAFAIDLLLNPDVKVVSLVGMAGSGKTLLAIAAGLQQTIGLRENPYTRMIVSRPVQPLGKDIGFLPGDVNEKMLPWLMPIQDNLKFLMGDKASVEMYMEKGKIEIEALTYIRGRSIANAFMIIDDIEQIDNIYVNETSNGLAHAVEKFKEFPIAGHVTFKKGERSEVATMAAKVL